MNYRRHRNGNGKVYSDVADVSRDTFLDRDSSVGGDSSVGESRLINSSANDSIIYNSYLSDCAVNDVTIRSHDNQSPRLVGVRLSEGFVEGNVKLIGPWEMSGPFYIREGVWRRPPRQLTLSDESGIYVGLTESWRGHAFIACNERSVAEWLASGIRIGLKLGWPLELAQQAYRFMEELADTPNVVAA